MSRRAKLSADDYADDYSYDDYDDYDDSAYTSPASAPAHDPMQVRQLLQLGQVSHSGGG